MAQMIFQRYEKKYVITSSQYNTLQHYMEGKMRPDRYGKYTIRNLYYDTDRYDLIRMSLERPVYKEKFRLRSYGAPGEGDPVFLELKKKYDGIVFKRRATLSYGDARRFLKAGRSDAGDSQIMDEIRYFMQRYPVEKKAFICYERTAMSGIDEPELRVTFDSNIRFRQTELSLDKGTWGTAVMEPGKLLMEIKAPGVYPLWLSRVLSELEIFPTTFSKYGVCYSRYICGESFGKEVGASA